MRMNLFKLRKYTRPRTHEGAPARVINAEQALRRSVLSCMLWEAEFYEDGATIADSFPFTCELSGSITKLSEITDVSNLQVDTSSWFE